MVEATFHFPPNFLWGTATASHQVEGNNIGNDMWQWEQSPGHILNGDRSGLACDWWGGRWREDFDRAAQGGQNAHRLSIEWSRIEPRPGVWDDAALGHYREMLRGLHQRGLRPMVTLHHFTNPLWLVEQGGWESEQVVGRFDHFTRKVVGALRDLVDLWCTINEPNVYAYSAYGLGLWPPGRHDVRATFRVMRNMLQAHAAAYHAIHELQPSAQVGVAQHVRGVRADTASPLDAAAARLQSAIFNESFVLPLRDGRVRFPLGGGRDRRLAGTLDYLGLNYYTREQVRFDLGQPGQLFGRRFFAPGTEISPTGFIANEPEGLFAFLRWGHRLGLPIYITENGVEDATDTMRPRYLIQHLHQVWRAVNFAWPVRGYFHWSLVDNFEWERGWSQRFGLWSIDPETQARVARPSAHLYGEICTENGLSSATTARYAPELLPRLFPG
jgi:beta-glucosidase